ncbi:Adenylosuccinate synthetase [Buchnera aphidicola (Periphyllus testudinaceus)]|uniref:adenylosuccinate synthase n=1 Tax=Buchnera aphidicola TaxID=9 RepID=UPI003463CA71
MIKNIVILGVQWGDEGKGKIVDLFSKTSDYVVRYQGGNNAGHTLLVNKKKIVLHLIPSCVLYKKTTAILGNGVVVSLIDLIKEINYLKEKNIFIKDRVILSHSITLIFEYHIFLDKAREESNLKSSIGTTRKGIGPAYEDKIARRAIRINDLNNVHFFSKMLKKNVQYYNFQLKNIYKRNIVSYKKIYNESLNSFLELKHMIQDVGLFLNKKIKKGFKIVFEGAQGSLLDIDHGTYPYVSSSNSTIGGVITGTGVGIKNIEYILGVSKLYSTRVGNGPFPTEVFGNIHNHLYKIGKEFGSTTGRIRRTGWLDLVLLKRMIQINSLSGICFTKLDVLDYLQTIKVCIKYINKDSKKELKIFPSNEIEWKNVIPVYKSFKGWNQSTKSIVLFKKLPKNVIKFINFIQNFIKISIDLISTGPERSEIIILNNFLKKFI